MFFKEHPLFSLFTFMRIIHLSDLHIGYNNCETNFGTIVTNIINTFPNPTDDVIIITGDLTDTGDSEAAIATVQNQIMRLEQSGFTVLIIPGNHDYGSGACANAKYVNLFKERYYKSTSVSYPKLDIIGNVAFIGLDSNAEELHWYDRFLAEGELGRKQLLELEQMLKSSNIVNLKKIVYLHHHPIKWKCGLYLKDRKKFLSIVENKVDVLLFGHLHRGADAKQDSFCGQYGIERIYNAGSSTHKMGDRGTVRVIDLHKAADTDFLLEIPN